MWFGLNMRKQDLLVSTVLSSRNTWGGMYSKQRWKWRRSYLMLLFIRHESVYAVRRTRTCGPFHKESQVWASAGCRLMSINRLKATLKIKATENMSFCTRNTKSSLLFWSPVFVTQVLQWNFCTSCAMLGSPWLQLYVAQWLCGHVQIYTSREKRKMCPWLHTISTPTSLKPNVPLKNWPCFQRHRNRTCRRFSPFSIIDNDGLNKDINSQPFVVIWKKDRVRKGCKFSNKKEATLWFLFVHQWEEQER